MLLEAVNLVAEASKAWALSSNSHSEDIEDTALASTIVAMKAAIGRHDDSKRKTDEADLFAVPGGGSGR